MPLRRKARRCMVEILAQQFPPATRFRAGVTVSCRLKRRRSRYCRTSRRSRVGWSDAPDREVYPGDIHEVPDADVFAGDVAAPGPAAETRGHRHAVCEGTGVRRDLRLPDRDPADRSSEREAADVVFVEGIDP